MSLLTLRRRLLILLVPLINFVFLTVFVFSPSSLPRVPKSFSARPYRPSSPAVALSDDVKAFEHIVFNRLSPPLSEQGSSGLPDGNEGAGSGSLNGASYLLDERKLVEGVELTELPEHLITTYRPGYLDAIPSLKRQHEPHSNPTGQHPQDQRRAGMTEERTQDYDQDPTTKYITFLPHSGFHNQRTELENALLLARMLNRTLIMPKAYLGPPMPWLTFRRLHARLLYQTKIGLEHCRAILESQEEQAGDFEVEEDAVGQDHKTTNGESQGDFPRQENDRHLRDNQVEKKEPLVFYAPSPSLPPPRQLFEQQQLSSRQGQQDQSNKDSDLYQHQYHHHHHHHRRFQESYADNQSPSTFQSEDGSGSKIRDNISYEGLRTGAIPISKHAARNNAILEEASDLQGNDEEESDEMDQPYFLDDSELEQKNTGVIEEPDRLDAGQDQVYARDFNHEAIVNEVNTDEARGSWVEKSEHDGDGQKFIDTGNNIEGVRELSGDLYGKDALQDFGDDEEKNIVEESDPLGMRMVITAILSKDDSDSSSWSTLTPLRQSLGRDWDMFFDLDPLRRHVRIVTRESMTMAYLADRFNLRFPNEEERNTTTCIGNILLINGTKIPCPGSGAEVVEGRTESEDKNALETEGDGGNGSNEDESGDDSLDESDDKKKHPLLQSAEDVLFFDDASLYDYRFTENLDAADSIRTRSKYKQEFTIDWLKNRPERLIHLGSIFGTGRVSIDSLESRAWLMMIKDHLILKTNILQTTSQRIVDKISGAIVEGGGRIPFDESHRDQNQQQQNDTSSTTLDLMWAGFVGIHIRMSDGHFSLTARETTENIRQELLWQTGITDDVREDDGGPYGSAFKKRDRLSVEQCRSRALNHRRALRKQLQQQRQERISGYSAAHSQEQHQQQHKFSRPPFAPQRRSNGRFTPIYLATDAYRPRDNPVFDRLFQTFECIFTLDDFTEDLDLLNRFRNPEDGALMAKFMIPMVDAMVVAKSTAFFGTPASTFSNYIQKQLRPAYTGLYD
ncbi:hypothetical protein EDD11_003573 [Mortierella claussenii]|nr:hypothetical protein EDD11_003573 [Mortierella claussenii]